MNEIASKNSEPNYNKTAYQDASSAWPRVAQGISGGAQMGECARQSAKGVIRDRARHLRAEADRLEALARALPEEMPPQADQALWDLAINSRRG